MRGRLRGGLGNSSLKAGPSFARRLGDRAPVRAPPMFPRNVRPDRLFDVKLNERPVHEISLSFWCPHLRPWPARMTEARAIHGDDTISLGRRERKSGSQQTLRWREMDSNHRSPVKDQLVETVLFEFPAEARKRTIGGRRYQPRDLGGDLRRDHNLRDDNDQLGWGRRQAQNGGSPDGGPMVRILLPPAGSLLRTRPFWGTSQSMKPSCSS